MALLFSGIYRESLKKKTDCQKLKGRFGMIWQNYSLGRGPCLCRENKKNLVNKNGQVNFLC